MAKIVKTDISTLSEDEQSKWPLDSDKVTVKYNKLEKKLPALQSEDFSNVYKHSVVFKCLRKDFHDKCAYCQSHLDFSTAYYPVEHYRPKAAYIPEGSKAKVSPAYWWLAYDWSNLLLSCQVCNTNKGNHFPLEKETQRDIPNKNVKREEPLILNPVADDFNEHIAYLCEEAKPKSGSRKGETTIRLLDLNREELLNSRRDALIAFLQEVRQSNHILEQVLQSDITEDIKDIVLQLMKIASAAKRRQYAARHFDGMFENQLDDTYLMSILV